jgi:hypothetical protein
MNYLTILYRKRGQSERVRQYASRTHAAAETAQMPEYTGMAKANLAWAAWQEGDLALAESEGRAALDLWDRLPAAHSSCVFQWAALCPLVGIALAQDRTCDAVAYARRLLEPTQQRLPDRLAAVIDRAITAWEEENPSAAHASLHQAIELAQELDYL